MTPFFCTRSGCGALSRDRIFKRPFLWPELYRSPGRVVNSRFLLDEKLAVVPLRLGRRAVGRRARGSLWRRSLEVRARGHRWGHSTAGVRSSMIATTTYGFRLGEALILRQRSRHRGVSFQGEIGGEGGIRTPGTVPRTLDFESSAFNRARPPLRFLCVAFLSPEL